MIIKQILEKIKTNNKYKTLSDGIILDEIKTCLKKNPNLNIKEIVKLTRKNLHKYYSSYKTKKKRKKYFYLNEFKENLNNKEKLIELTNKFLSMNLSTKERLEDYPELYEKIFKITGKPKVIVDLGSGFNPLSLPYMNLKKLNYFVYDVDKEDIKFLNDYFKIINKNNINGIAFILDIRKKQNISKIPDSDIVFLFKIIDIIDVENHKPSEELIKALIKKTKNIVVSFPTKTFTKKQMNFPKRKGFEIMLDRINLKFEKIKTNNEVFYVIKK